MYFLFDIVYHYAKVGVVVVALIVFVVLGNCISECVTEFAGDY